ncbi:LOW QUALITY PROTEIN: N-terminal EF-hand calcium-binding protein 2 [Morus bassanus]
MCEQAARYCWAGVHGMLRKPPAALRGLDGLLPWAARMSDKGTAERELLTPGAAAGQRKGTSVILDIFRRPDKNDLLQSMECFEPVPSPFDKRPGSGCAGERAVQCINPFPPYISHPATQWCYSEQVRDMVYESGNNVDQFVTCFLLKEMANESQSLLSSVESAVDAIDEQTNPARHYSSKAGHSLMDTYDSPMPSYSPTSRMVPREHGKNFQTGSPKTKADGLEEQINRLAELISRLEDKALWFDLHQRLSDSENTACTYLLLVQDEMTVSHKHLGEFCSSLKQYLKSVAGERDCFHVTTVKLPDRVTFIVYKFWETEEDLRGVRIRLSRGCHCKGDGELGRHLCISHLGMPLDMRDGRHLQSATCKGFQHVKVDTLSQPEAVSSMAVPAAWCTLSQE